MTPRKILVTGGAGYIGSHTVQLLLEQGYDVAVADNLSKGYRHNVPKGRLFEINIADTKALTELMRQTRTQAVIHFAAFIAVGESMREPETYFANNVCASLSLLTAMLQAGVKHVVFSSTAAVYGNPHASPILETFPIQPVNPYGESKVMVETMLRWFGEIHHLTSVCLRYFNASGCDPQGRLGEEHEPETHLIPLLLRAVRTGKPVTVFGDDYDTPDGTCMRDYIHVLDLAQAHILALEYLMAGGATAQEATPANDRFGLATPSVEELAIPQEKPADLPAAFMWATAANQARLYLLSGLESEVAEELFTVPLQHAAQAQRLVTADATCVLLPDADRTLAVLS